jgi:alkanesulfonate monooxygenase SsuD/methylene tetrahydromethanopterin reductase-like flavin-dependent oxidoreductase (luciferase family)
MENHGVQHDKRFRLMREQVLAIKELWTQDEAQFHGRHVDFDPVWMYPKPLQKPHPPILLGGETDYTLQRVVEFADAWMPRTRRGWEPSLGAARLRAAAETVGRDPATVSITVFNVQATESVFALNRNAGIERVLVEVPSIDRDQVLRLLDGVAPLVARYAG